MKLRPYQNDAADRVVDEWESVARTLVVMPTGLGKTVLFADIIRRLFPRRAMVIAHREELIFQAADKIRRVTGLRAEVEMGEYRITESLFGAPSVVVSTVQTQTAGGDGGGRLGKFDPADFGLLIVDECHHATSASYRRIIDYYCQNPELRVLGVTATPDRADEEALGQVFESVAYDYEILDAIHDGWLVPIEQQMVNVSGLDLSQIRTTAGDLNGADLAAVMEAEEMLHQIASPALEIIGRKRALVFTASVAQAERLAEIFNRHRANMADWVCGKTDKQRRRDILRRYAEGQIQVVCNCGVLAEGFDDPGVEVIVMGRPTKSRSLYAQQVGRATRPLPGVVDGPKTPEERRAAIESSAKPSCLVVDFCGNSGRHKLMTAADVLGGNVADQVVEAAIKRARAAGKPVRMDQVLTDEAEAAVERTRAEAARRARLTIKAKWTACEVNPFDVFQLEPVKERGWDHDKQLSEKQRGLLIKQGIDPDKIPYAQGKQLIAEIFRRWDSGACSFKQAKLLKSRGLPFAVTRDEAKRMIDEISAKEHWPSRTAVAV